MKKLLFVCSENRLRSPTAEAVFSRFEGVQAIGAGTNADASTPVSGDLIEWADLIFVMEERHRSKISRRYSKLLKNKRMIVLDVPDRYGYMQPELVEILKARVLNIIQISSMRRNLQSAM
ncbi:MAG: phosphotyrosine protein phosphatase [Deltaproteobacteria bacterium]|nr:phosphotyrosine protein phosphatase [Deltaproteobacteria bacterium]